MIAYLVISYVFMFLIVVVSSIKGNETIGLKMFLLSPLWFPIALPYLLIKLLEWSVK